MYVAEPGVELARRPRVDATLLQTLTGGGPVTAALTLVINQSINHLSIQLFRASGERRQLGVTTVSRVQRSDCTDMRGPLAVDRRHNISFSSHVGILRIAFPISHKGESVGLL